MERHQSLIATKLSSASNIYMLTHKGVTVTNPNTFNDYFSLLTEKTKVNTK